MNIQQVIAGAKKMQIGENREFELDEEPKRFELAVVTLELGKEDGKFFSISRSGKNLKIHCYKPGR